MKRLALAIAIASISAAAGPAYAGGYEAPDNGTEALGRGATFTAKADSPLATYYNVGGLATQRGTRLEVDVDLKFNNVEFQRTGVYPGDASNPYTPWAGQPFPNVKNRGGMFFAPGIYLSSDFHYFERWTFGLALFGPSSIGNRDYRYTTRAPNGITYPSPGRYDFAGADLSIILPTVAAAVRVTRWLSLGLAVHLVYGNFELRSTSIIDPGGTDTAGNPTCGIENPECDAKLALKVKGMTATASFGAHIKLKNFAFGLNLRGPAYITAKGNAESISPRILGGGVQEPSKATFKNTLPIVLRLGGRYMFKKDDFERGDIELDIVYESWKMAQNPGPTINMSGATSFAIDSNVAKSRAKASAS